jgi:hypothetical protein
MSSGNAWTDSFPGNFQWSNATLVCKGMAPYGAVALEEIERICERLRARGALDADAWWQEWCAEAERNEKLADAAAAEHRDATAGNLYLRAGNYHYAGERFVPLGERKLGIYKKALRCYHEGLARHSQTSSSRSGAEGKTLRAAAEERMARGAKAPPPSSVF